MQCDQHNKSSLNECFACKNRFVFYFANDLLFNVHRQFANHHCLHSRKSAPHQTAKKLQYQCLSKTEKLFLNQFLIKI